jgi:uncharacterized membrane protein
MVQSNLVALLCYLGMWLTGIVFLIAEKEDRFIRFHAWQSIITFGGLTIIELIFASLVPIIGVLVTILMLVLWFILMIRAYQGQAYKLPLVGDWAESQANK